MRTRSTTLAFCVAITAGLVLTAPALGQGRECTNQTLRGTYVVSITGFITRATPPQFAISVYSPVTVVGAYTFDGTGHVSRSLKVNFGGQPIPVTDRGSYEVHTDCNGSTSFPTNQETLQFTWIDIDTLAIVSTTPGAVGAGSLRKQSVANCSTETLRGAWVFDGSGLGTFQSPPQATDAFFPVAVVGTWTFDGKGGVSRSLALNFAGLPGPYIDSATYQVNPDCTASAYFPSDGEPFDLTMVNSTTVVYGVAAVGRAGAGLLRKKNAGD